MFKVIEDPGEEELGFEHPLAAISHAITRSMAGTSEARVVVNDNVVCVARNGLLFAAADGHRAITPAEAVQTAESLVGRK
jgi:hypothetical protein